MLLPDTAAWLVVLLILVVLLVSGTVRDADWLQPCYLLRTDGSLEDVHLVLLHLQAVLVLLESGWQRRDDSLLLVIITLTAVDVTLLVLGGSLGAVLIQFKHQTGPLHLVGRIR